MPSLKIIIFGYMLNASLLLAIDVSYL